MWEQLWTLSLTVPKWMVYSLVFIIPKWILSKAPQGNIQGRLKLLSLGMPRKASPLSSSKLSVYLTWSYIFIHHMICVLLGESIYFASICLMLFIIMFCNFSFKKNVKDSLLPCLFCKYTCCCLKTESLPLLQKFLRKVRMR